MPPTVFEPVTPAGERPQTVRPLGSAKSTLLTENVLTFIGYKHSDACVDDIILHWGVAGIFREVATAGSSVLRVALHKYSERSRKENAVTEHRKIKLSFRFIR
jgi:hypothetical protein